MDHEAYENEMIDAVNRHSAEYVDTPESKVTVVSSVFTKADAKAIRQGLKRTLLAIFTAVMFALSVFCFIRVAVSAGYWAVILFFVAIALMGCAFVLLYAQGITHVGRQGDGK